MYWILCAGVVALLVGLVVFFIPSLTGGRSLYNPQEETEAERRAWHNEKESELARAHGFGFGNETYIDYDGFARNAYTHERTYMNRTDTGNGKSKKY